MEWKGQVAVVTGASSGIGRAIALALMERGAAVALVGRSLERLGRTLKSARRGAVGSGCYRADLQSEAQVRRLCARVRRELGGPDILVHAAGIFVRAGLAEARVP